MCFQTPAAGKLSFKENIEEMEGARRRSTTLGIRTCRITGQFFTVFYARRIRLQVGKKRGPIRNGKLDLRRSLANFSLAGREQNKKKKTEEGDSTELPSWGIITGKRKRNPKSVSERVLLRRRFNQKKGGKNSEGRDRIAITFFLGGEGRGANKLSEKSFLRQNFLCIICYVDKRKVQKKGGGTKQGVTINNTHQKDKKEFTCRQRKKRERCGESG